MFGFLNINKPAGISSRQVVNEVQRLVRPDKVGHAGTLDPLATGVLVVAIGPATRLIEYVHRLPKRYDAWFLLGVRSDTDDITGQLEQLADPIQPTREQIEAATGTAGRACLAASSGLFRASGAGAACLRTCPQRRTSGSRPAGSVYPIPRTCFHTSTRNCGWTCSCGSGTYVRALGRDLAASLGTAAVMSALTRTAVGRFDVGAGGCDLEELTAESLSTLLLPPLSVFPDTPPESLSSDEAQHVRQGQAIRRPGHERSGDLPAIDAAGRLVAILTPLDDDRLRPVRTF